jgi:hypothetical protein
MTKVEPKERFFDLAVRGIFGKPFEYGVEVYGYGNYGDEEKELLLNGYGIQQLGVSEYGSNNLRWGIYQKRYSHWVKINGKRKWFGPVKYIREKFYQGSGNGTEEQDETRTRFRLAMEAWANLTQEQKEVYNQRARYKNFHGVNLFIREWLKSN